MIILVWKTSTYTPKSRGKQTKSAETKSETSETKSSETKNEKIAFQP